jgi:hypothetical protein
MQHKSNSKPKLDEQEKSNVKHKPSFYVTATVISIFTAALSTAAFAIHGVLATGIRILSL